MTRPETPKPADDRNPRFVELLGKYERQLNSYVLALVPNWADADDIVQQTRIRLWEQFDSYDATKDFGAWARVIAHFQVMTHRKQVSRAANRLTDGVLEKLADTALSITESTNSRQVFLAECIEEMSEESRRLLARCYSGTETIKSVASDLDRSSNSVRQTLFRMRTRLFGCVESKMEEEETP